MNPTILGSVRIDVRMESVQTAYGQVEIQMDLAPNLNFMRQEWQEWLELPFGANVRTVVRIVSVRSDKLVNKNF